MMNGTTQRRGDLIHQLEALERQVISLRAQLLPDPPPRAREAFTAVTVELGTSLYALPTTMVQKIIPLVAWQPLPESPNWVLGVFRYYGQTLPLIDLHRRLLEDEVPLTSSMVIIITKPPSPIGLVASSITSLLRVRPQDITPPPPDVTYAPFITGSVPHSEGRVMHILSTSRLGRELVLGPESHGVSPPLDGDPKARSSEAPSP